MGSIAVIASWYLGRTLLSKIHNTIESQTKVDHNTDYNQLIKKYLNRFWPSSTRKQRSLKILTQQPESFYLPCYQGIHLHCWVYRQSTSVRTSKWLILLHDWAENIFQVFIYADLYYRHGYNILLSDAREHGLNINQDLIFSFGYFEKFDLIKILTWLNREFKPQQIVLHGRGAGTVTLLEGWKLIPKPLEPLISRVVLENSWLSPLNTLANWPHAQGGWLWPTCYRFGLQHAVKKEDHYSIKTICPTKDLHQIKNKCPVLLLHNPNNKLTLWKKVETFWQHQIKNHLWSSLTVGLFDYDSKTNTPRNWLAYEQKIIEFLKS